MNYKDKYLKYKSKYLNYKKNLLSKKKTNHIQSGGMSNRTAIGIFISSILSLLFYGVTHSYYSNTLHNNISQFKTKLIQINKLRKDIIDFYSLSKNIPIELKEQIREVINEKNNIEEIQKRIKQHKDRFKHLNKIPSISSHYSKIDTDLKNYLDRYHKILDEISKYKSKSVKQLQEQEDLEDLSPESPIESIPLSPESPIESIPLSPESPIESIPLFPESPYNDVFTNSIDSDDSDDSDDSNDSSDSDDSNDSSDSDDSNDSSDSDDSNDSDEKQDISKSFEKKIKKRAKVHWIQDNSGVWYKEKKDKKN